MLLHRIIRRLRRSLAKSIRALLPSLADSLRLCSSFLCRRIIAEFPLGEIKCFVLCCVAANVRHGRGLFLCSNQEVSEKGRLFHGRQLPPFAPFALTHSHFGFPPLSWHFALFSKFLVNSSPVRSERCLENLFNGGCG